MELVGAAVYRINLDGSMLQHEIGKAAGGGSDIKADQSVELKRELLDENGQIVADISYQTRPYIDGTIVFTHHQLDYKITIETYRADTEK